jgi:hypothetical protein
MPAASRLLLQPPATLDALLASTELARAATRRPDPSKIEQFEEAPR